MQTFQNYECVEFYANCIVNMIKALFIYTDIVKIELICIFVYHFYWNSSNFISFLFSCQTETSIFSVLGTGMCFKLFSLKTINIGNIEDEYRGSYMSAHVLLNLLNELGKRDKMQGLPSNLSLFRNKFNKFNNTRA